MVRKHSATLVVASPAVTMGLGIAAATIVVRASSAGASTANFQCACNPDLSSVESDVAGLPRGQHQSRVGTRVHRGEYRCGHRPVNGSQQSESPRDDQRLGHDQMSL
jgi:hypothetical protein